MLTIDGSLGEGGGQVLRSALALSLLTGKSFRIVRIRAHRAVAGLRRQHLTAVRAAAAVGKAVVRGDFVGSTELSFEATEVKAGAYDLDIGSAGSTILVAQTVLPALAHASGPSSLRLSGGTHNPLAPSYEFFDRAYLPLLARMGPSIESKLLRHGFVPRGGGVIEVRVVPAPLRPLLLLERGAVLRRSVRAIVAGLPASIAERELRAAQRALGWEEACFALDELDPACGPGNVVVVEIECEHVTEVFTSVGQRGVRAETVAERAAGEATTWLATGAPVGPYLTDQLVLPLAIAGGALRASALTLHARTQIDIVRSFTAAEISVEREGGRVFRLSLQRG